MSSITRYSVLTLLWTGICLTSHPAFAQLSDWNFLDQNTIRFESSGLAGQQPGVDDGFVRTGAFLSLFHNQQQNIFVEGHGIANFDVGTWAGDFGLGYRHNVNGVVWGANVFTNCREYSNGETQHNFNSVGFGGEALMSNWAVRGNAFFSTQGRVSNGGAYLTNVNPVYVPEPGADPGVQNILLGVSKENWDEALDGFDLNVSRKIPQIATEIGMGIYYLATNHSQDAWGVTGSGQTWLTQNVSLGLNLSHDAMFDTTLAGELTLYFGGPRVDVTGRSNSSFSRLFAPTQRRRILPVLNYTTDGGAVYATDPTTGDRISVVQVDTGDDILGAPDLREADMEFVDIILADPNSVFMLNDAIGLHDNQRLLSANLDHLLDTTELGTILLPESNLGGASSMLIGGDDINLVTLANNNEVSGFDFTVGTDSNGILGTNITGFNINRNVMDGNGMGFEGIRIDADGIAATSGVIRDNMIMDFTNDGVDIDGIDIAVDFLNNTITGNGDDNIDIDGEMGDFSGLVMGNVLNGAGRHGLDIDAATISNDILGNTANMNDDGGIILDIGSVAAGQVLNIEDNIANFNGTPESGAPGIEVVFYGAADSNVFIDNNTTAGNDGTGMILVSTGPGDIIGTLSNNTSNNSVLDGGFLILSIDPASDLRLDILGNRAERNEEPGFLILAANDFIGDFDNNVAIDNFNEGVVFEIDNDFIGNVTNNTSNDNRDGFFMDVANVFDGNFLMNTANDNFLDGFNTTAGTVSGGSITSPNFATGNGTNFTGNIAAP